MPGSPPALLDRRLLFVTGKGGVGKTTIASALGVLGARHGKRVLLCAMESPADLSLTLECGRIAYAPKEALPGLFTMAMDTEAALREYLHLNYHLPIAGRLGPMADALDFVATAAPGVREILTVGKLCYEVRERHFDLVVVDASATGHIVGHLAAPVAINDLVRVGAIRDQTRWMLDILGDAMQTGVVIVTTPEETPVNEAIDLASQLGTSTSVPLGAVVANRLLPELFGRSEEETFERLEEEAGRMALLGALRGAVGRLEEVLSAARLAMQLRRSGAEHLDRLRSSLDPAVPLFLLPLLFTSANGPRGVQLLADALEEEI